MSNWISVKDRLPDKEGLYLVSGSNKVWVCQLFGICGIFGFSSPASKPIIQAWQPLPEPYVNHSQEKGLWLNYEASNGGTELICSLCHKSGNGEPICPYCEAKMSGTVSHEYYYDSISPKLNKEKEE